MVYQKLEDDIRQALAGKEYGRNKIVVVTNYNGGIEIYDFEEDPIIEDINDLKEQINNLESDNSLITKERDELAEKLEEEGD